MESENHSWTLGAIAAGLVAAVTFAAFQLTIAASTEGASGPPRMVAAMAFGPRAFQASFPWGTAALAAAVIHLAISVGFALVFIGIVQPSPFVTSPSLLVLRAGVFGTAVWVINYYVIGPMLEWTWFAERTAPSVQWAAHTFFYGTVIGVLLNRHAVVVDSLNEPEGPPRRV